MRDKLKYVKTADRASVRKGKKTYKWVDVLLEDIDSCLSGPLSELLEDFQGMKDTYESEGFSDLYLREAYHGDATYELRGFRLETEKERNNRLKKHEKEIDQAKKDKKRTEAQERKFLAKLKEKYE